jgi:hypothetical protein
LANSGAIGGKFSDEQLGVFLGGYVCGAKQSTRAPAPDQFPAKLTRLASSPRPVKIQWEE